MGTVIAFPQGQRVGRVKGFNAPNEPAAVVILPVIRIERHADTLSGSTDSGAPASRRRRRRRADRT
jgi:hypothetical protein